MPFVCLSYKRLWLGFRSWLYCLLSLHSLMKGSYWKASVAKEPRAVSHQQPAGNWGRGEQHSMYCILPTTALVGLEADLWPAELSDKKSQVWLTLWLQPCKTSWNRRRKWAVSGFLTHRNCGLINVCCFKSLNLGAICYTVIDKN